MILVFAAQNLVGGFTEFFILDSANAGQVWRFVSAIFLHGSLTHLVLNLFALILFGSVLEKLIGGRNFLIVFFATGILANLAAVNFYNSSLGASGAIFGILGVLIMIKPLMIIWAFGLPMPLFVAGILWAAADVMGIFMPSNVGNIAHLAGMFFGLIFGIFFRRLTGRSGLAAGRRRISIDERAVRKWEDDYMLR